MMWTSAPKHEQRNDGKKPFSLQSSESLNGKGITEATTEMHLRAPFILPLPLSFLSLSLSLRLFPIAPLFPQEIAALRARTTGKYYFGVGFAVVLQM